MYNFTVLAQVRNGKAAKPLNRPYFGDFTEICSKFDQIDYRWRISCRLSLITEIISRNFVPWETSIMLSICLVTLNDVFCTFFWIFF